MNHVSVSPTNGNGPTQGQRKTLTRVGIEPTTFGSIPTLVRILLSPCVGQEKMRGQRGRLPVQPLEYVMSTKVIFRRTEVSVLAEVCLPRRPHAGQPRSDV